jgi:hypothetical protein
MPEVTLVPGAAVSFGFSAVFDNGVLALADGTPTRVEVIVTFGNAATSGQTAASVDINGNGLIDIDEAHVRSLPARLTFTVPAATTGADAVALSDSTADITTTGTARFVNATFNLGATSGTANVIYDGGESGGTITNCAHLQSNNSHALQACDTQTVPPAAAGSVTPTSLDFGSVVVGSGRWVQFLTLTNTGSIPLTAIALTFASPEFSSPGDNCGTTLARDASCTIWVEFSPTGLGTVTSSLTVTAEAPEAGSLLIIRPIEISLTGTGIEAPTLPTVAFTPNPFDFGGVDQGLFSSGPTQMFALTNNTANTVTGITQATLSVPDAEKLYFDFFSIERLASSCGPSVNGQLLGITALAPGQSCFVTVQFSPHAAYAGTTTYTMLSVSDSAGTQTAILIGTALCIFAGACP